MAKLPKRAAERIVAGLKRFQPIVAAAKARDINESDTVVIVTDLLQEIFGYDKYSEITSEHAIRGTYCDLAVNIGGSLACLIEVKAIGLELKEQHVKQAVDYAANQGCEWVALTNAVDWRVYRVVFGKPIDHELVVDIDLLTMNPRKPDDVELVGLLAKEGWQKANLGEYHNQRQALSRFTLAQLLLGDAVADVLRREIRRLSPEVRVDVDQIKEVIEVEILKRDVIEGEKSDAAKKQIARAVGRQIRASAKASDSKLGQGAPAQNASSTEPAPDNA